MHPAPRQPDGEDLQTPASAAWDMRQTPVVAWRSHFSKALGLVNVGDDVLLDPSGLRSLGVLESPYLTLDRVPVCLSGVDNVWCVKLCVLLPVCLQGVFPLYGTAWLWNKRSKCPSVHGSMSPTLPAQPEAGSTCHMGQTCPSQHLVQDRSRLSLSAG